MEGTQTKYVPFFHSFYEVAKDLNDERRLQLYDAVLEYGFFATWPAELDDDETLGVAFKLIRPNIDASIKRQVKNSEAGKASCEARRKSK